MTENNIFTLEKISKNGRLNKYLKECSMILKQKDDSGLERFMKRIFGDCVNYLEKVLGFYFPRNIIVEIIYDADRYAKLKKKYEKKFGRKVSNKAFIAGFSHYDVIYINFQSHFEGKTIANFIVDLCLTFIEELVHSIHPNKSNTEIIELVRSTIEGLLEIKLTDDSKQEYLEQARI